MPRCSGCETATMYAAAESELHDLSRLFCLPCYTLSGLRYQVGDAPLSSISVQGNVQVGGKLVAVGDVNGTVSLLEVNSLRRI